MVRIALLEDDQDLSDVLCGWLRQAGYDCRAYSNGRVFMRAMGRESFDLILLDWLVPGLNGPEVLRRLRVELDRRIPVIFVTARDAEEDIVTALEAGADDYLVKPVRRRELLVRIQALCRRAYPPADRASVLQVGPFTLDMARRCVSDHGRTIALTDKEFELAAFLFRHCGQLLSRSHLLESVWGVNAEVNTRTLDTHVSRLRTKLGLRPERGVRLTAVYNAGYRLEVLADVPHNHSQ